LVLTPLLFALTSCGGGDRGTLRIVYKQIEVGHLRFVMPATMTIEQTHQGHDVFRARSGGKVRLLPGIVVTKIRSHASWETVTNDIYAHNTVDAEGLEGISDTPMSVVGADRGELMEHHYVARDAATGAPRPATLTTLVLLRRQRVWIVRIVVDDAHSGAIDTDRIVNSVQLT
jgi:hypothetical protein